MKRTAFTAVVLFLLLTLPAVLQAQRGDRDQNLEAARRALDVGEPERALELVAPLLRGAGDDAEALLLRSTARFVLGELDAGRVDLARCLELDPTLRQAWLNRAGLDIAEERYDDALEALGTAERLDPEAPDNRINIGAVELLAGDVDAATASFAQHIEDSRTRGARGADLAEAYYLVATNYAASGYDAQALENLRGAVAADERTRLRVRLDPNFEHLITDSAVQQLLTTDSHQVPASHHQVSRTFAGATYAGGEGTLLPALLDALRVEGVRFDARVERTPRWALVWGDLRIKVADGRDGARLEVSADPRTIDATGFERRAAALFEAVDRTLVARAPKGAPPAL
jgi:tetratricopeptide (TPR) repeat protein